MLLRPDFASAGNLSLMRRQAHILATPVYLRRLYYYYHTFAAALNASKLAELTDDKGAVHDWRDDLVAELAKRQQPDGSWANENRQWFENDKNLATAFALIALSYCDSQD